MGVNFRGLVALVYHAKFFMFQKLLQFYLFSTVGGQGMSKIAGLQKLLVESNRKAHKPAIRQGTLQLFFFKKS